MKTFFNLKNQNKECYNPSMEAKRDCNIRRSGFENTIYFFLSKKTWNNSPKKWLMIGPNLPTCPKPALISFSVPYYFLLWCQYPLINYLVGKWVRDFLFLLFYSNPWRQSSFSHIFLSLQEFDVYPWKVIEFHTCPQMHIVQHNHLPTFGQTGKKNHQIKGPFINYIILVGGGRRVAAN